MEGGFSGVAVSVALTRVSQLFWCGCEGAPQVVLWCLSFFIWSCKWNFQKYPHWDWCFELSFKDLKEAAGKCFLFEKKQQHWSCFIPIRYWVSEGTRPWWDLMMLTYNCIKSCIYLYEKFNLSWFFSTFSYEDYNFAFN